MESERIRFLFNSGRLIWVFQVFSGILLIVIVGLHWFFQHSIVGRGGPAYANVVAYLRCPLFFGLETILLLVVIVHALLGIRAILLDRGLSVRTLRWVNWGLFIVGTVALSYGLRLTLALAHLRG
jgi:succinate dehydrogenase hydrophobic anchor subunit